MKKNTFEEFKTYLYGKIFPNQSKQVSAINVRDSIETLAESLYTEAYVNSFEDSFHKISVVTNLENNKFSCRIDLKSKSNQDYIMPNFEIIPVEFGGKKFLKSTRITFLLDNNSNLSSTGVFNFNDLFGENDGSTTSILNPGLFLAGSYAIVEGSYDTDGANGPGIPDSDLTEVGNMGVPFDNSTTSAYNTTYKMKEIGASNLEMSYVGGGCVGDIIILIEGMIL